jgi:hypothetical protein
MIAVPLDEGSIVDGYFSSKILPTNFYVTIRELGELAESARKSGTGINARGRTKLRCLAHLLYEQVIGGADPDVYLSLQREWQSWVGVQFGNER